MGSSTPPTDMLASPTLTLDSTTATLDTTLDTPMPTTERGPLMLSPRPRLIPPSSTPPTDMVPTPTLTATLDSTTATLDTPMPTTTERGPLMPSPRPMPSTEATATDTVDTEDTTGDKSSSRVQSKSSTRTSLLVNLTFHPSVRLLGGVGI